MAKSYQGNHEDESTGWEVLGSVGVYDGVQWHVYRQRHENEWDYVKVVAEIRAPGKANYWLSWNGTRFAQGRDFFKVMQHRHDLSQRLVEFMAEQELASAA
jgi:hypothetical protein